MYVAEATCPWNSLQVSNELRNIPIWEDAFNSLSRLEWISFSVGDVGVWNLGHSFYLNVSYFLQSGLSCLGCRLELVD
jgi:hypothetical protein